MSRKHLPELNSGALQNIIENGLRPNENTLLQILGHKAIKGDKGNVYRLLISDGKYSYAYGMLPGSLNHLIEEGLLENYTIIRAKRCAVNQVLTTATAGTVNRRLIFFMDIEPLVAGSDVGGKIGNPKALIDNGEICEEPEAKPAPTESVKKHNLDSTLAPPSKTGRYEQKITKPDVIAHSITSLTPYSNKWTIQVRIINKSEIRTWSNANGEGKLFSMDMMDDTGEIRATAFNAECDKFYHMVEIGKVYYISQAKLKAANKQYSKIKNDYEMTFNKNTTVYSCDEATKIPPITFNFVPIAQLPNMDKDSVIDVIGVVKSAKDVRCITSKTTKTELKLREVQMVDSTNAEVNLTFWGKLAEEFDATSKPVVALKGAKLSDFGGRSLGTVSSTVVQINPDMAEAQKLREWYDNIDSSLVVSSISTSLGAGTASRVSFKTFAEAKFENMGTKDKPDYYSVKAMVLKINKEKALHMACPIKGCTKKVIDQGNGIYHCEKCQRDYREFKWRLILSVNIADATDHQWVTCFQETAEILLGKSANDVVRLKDYDNNEFLKIFEEVTFRWYIFRLRVKMETYNDESRLKTNVCEVKKINHKEHNEQLIREMKENF